MDNYQYRSLKWEPEKVIISQRDSAVMINPNEPIGHFSPFFALQLIGVRNLCKRTLEKCCTIEFPTKS